MQLFTFGRLLSGRFASVFCVEVLFWCWTRVCEVMGLDAMAQSAFQVGTMSLEEADAGIFTGLQFVWDGAQISLQPRMPDPWAAHCYDELDNFPLKPWQSWGPPQLFKTTVRGLLCRCWYFSNSRQVFRAALWEVLVALVLRANFPWHFVKQNAMAWARTWVPKGRCSQYPLFLMM